jgi:pSer/pThr/pTyr-binding forkhead associated (FHA) protein
MIVNNPTLIGKPSSKTKPDVPIDDPWVSREHLKITCDNGSFLLVDLGSTNGTSLNGKKIIPGKSYELNHKATIGLAVVAGEPRILLRFWDSDDTTVAEELGYEKMDAYWLRIDDERKIVWVDGNPIKIPRREYLLLQCLYRRAGKNCSRDLIEEEVWPEAAMGTISNSAIEAHISRLRKKVEHDPTNPKRIISNKGFGYTLVLLYPRIP